MLTTYLIDGMDVNDNRRWNLRAHAIKAAGARGWLAWLSEKLDRSASQISQLVGTTPSRNIGIKLAREFELTLGMEHGQLDRAVTAIGEKPPEHGNNFEPGPDVRPVPLISWVQAGNWNDIQDNFRPGEAERMVMATKRVSERSYAVRVVGDSMEPRFPPGCIIIVDPDKDPAHGSPVIVRLVDSKEATFKLLMFDGDTKYLKPINPAYPTMPLDKSAVLAGVVVQMFMDVE